jgi:hypothetical protein
MKIRPGFVSNSSSTSFVCWGIPVGKIKNKIIRCVLKTKNNPDNTIEVGGENVFVGLTPSVLKYEYKATDEYEIKKIVAQVLSEALSQEITVEDVEYTSQEWYDG